MLDAHVHIDQYDNPSKTASLTSQKSVFAVAVTNLPSHFKAGLPHVKNLRNVKLAIGMHPLASAKHGAEVDLFFQLLNETSFVGEIGLDGSREGKATIQTQKETFALIAKSLSNKIVSIHSRGAEEDVLDILVDNNVKGAIFHWYTGSESLIERILSNGHYFSVNPSMVASNSGRKTIGKIPLDRLLTETDGPFVKIRGRITQPWDVEVVETYLSRMWSLELDEVRGQIWKNFVQMAESQRVEIVRDSRNRSR